MKNITDRFTRKYWPTKSLVIYTAERSRDNCFVEAFDFNAQGKMINAHPLTMEESRALAKVLSFDFEKEDHCFRSEGLLPINVLYVRQADNGCVIWHTPAQKRDLLFKEELTISDGDYPVPALLWKASKEKLSVFALKNNKRPVMNTLLYEAPYFNIHPDGDVCMGTVDIQVASNSTLEQFMALWESYFFNSRFSHLLGSRSPVKNNIVQLYQGLLGKEHFPFEELIQHPKKIKDMLHENE